MLSRKSFLNISSLLLYEYLKVSSVPQVLLNELSPPPTFYNELTAVPYSSIHLKKAVHQVKTTEISPLIPKEKYDMDKI